jgi:hypothetical protein
LAAYLVDLLLRDSSPTKGDTDHDAALAKFASILRHKPRPLTKSQPPEFNKNPELISKE